ncbi:MAG: hypothetical protein JNK37_00370 [Verrucomicrobiales bacterium]|nr:hypothetical protein [Verrucomicrobiales bacterium]
MVHYIALYKLAKGVDESAVDDLMRSSRSFLFRIQEAHNARSGKRIDAGMEYPFFISIDFESLDKLMMFRDDPVWLKFQHDHISPVTSSGVEMVYETEPGKNLKYS